MKTLNFSSKVNLVPYRKTILAEGEIYHIFNRGVAKLPIYFSKYNYFRFLYLINYYRFVNTPTSFSNFMKLPVETRSEILNSLRKDNNLHVEVLAFCLMTNHFHLLLKQISPKGIITFMGNVQNSHVKYLNTKEERVGPLFQSPFKAVRIETDEQLLHVSRYIHLNPSTEYLVEIENLSEYPWSSLPVYINPNNQDFTFVNTEPVMSFFKGREKYQEFIIDQAEYQRGLNQIKHLILE